MIINVEDFNPALIDSIPMAKRNRGNPGTRRKIKYKNIICAFDIETTALDDVEQSIMYIWQFQFGENLTIIGHYWDEFLNMLKSISIYLQDNEYILIFVHNLQYEFTFLSGVYDFKSTEVFCMDSRKVLKCEMFNHFEFRCSYIHSNMNLKSYLHKMNVTHQKLDGDEFNYDKKRFPWDCDMSEKELEYCVNDVLGLVEAIKTEMEKDGDNLYTFPLTSTGYVRREIKKTMRLVNHDWIAAQLPSYELYLLLREAFRGGNTHANRYLAGMILENVKSADRSSSYPDILTKHNVPVTPFIHVGAMYPEDFNDLIWHKKKAILTKICIHNIELRDKMWGCPYIPEGKCSVLINAARDNGRVLQADYLEMTVTDVDLKIIIDEYDFSDIVYKDVYYADYGMLPECLRNLIIHYYEDKTLLKGIDDYLYGKTKALLNSVYGCLVMTLVRPSIIFENHEYTIKEENPINQLNKANKNAFILYQWGVWCTALAREELEHSIRLAHGYELVDGEWEKTNENVTWVYADTDSCKYIGDIDWSPYNNHQIETALKYGAVAKDRNGKMYHMGVFEFEGEYEKFVTLGAKKYCYLQDGELHVTVSGVNKKLGATELAENGGIESFKEGFIFKKAGGLESVYNDNPPIKNYTVDGHQIEITSNLYLKPSTYTLGTTIEYHDLIQICQKLLTKGIWK